jgi:hypothetical protein
MVYTHQQSVHSWGHILPLWPPNGGLSIFFQSREQVIVRQDQIWRIGWVIKTLEAQVGQFLLGCKCLVSRGTVVLEQDPLGDLPAALRWAILRVDSLAPWKIINEEDAVLIQKNWGENFSGGFLQSEFFGGRGGVSRYAATPFIVVLSLGQSDINRFRPWSPVMTGIHLDCAEKTS